MNETTAKVRRSTEKLRGAEALASIAALNGTDFSKVLQTKRRQAWEAFGLYWEHDWTADGPVSQKDRANWQIKIQKQISTYVDTLYQLSRAALANQIGTGPGIRFYVFNPLSWLRSDVADFEYDGSASTVIDITTGKEVPSQPIIKGGKKMIRILAENIPSVGYKVFEISNSTSGKFSNSVKVENEYIKNNFFRIRIRPSGVITEWYDSLAGSRQLIKETNERYVNDIGTKDNSIGKFVVENTGPVSTTIKTVSSDPLPHTSRITIYAHNARIDIEDSIQSNFRDLKTWAFSFNFSAPTTHHEELGAILTAKNETRGGHYASQNARYDWLTFNHFADMSEGAYGITLSNIDCSFFSLGNSTPDSLWENSSQLKALAGGQTDPYTGLSTAKKDTVMMGIYRQNGETDFLYQFALRSHQRALHPASEMKFALEHQNPLITQRITGDTKNNKATQFSLLQIENPNVLLWSVKPAEEGIASGFMTRLWNFDSTLTQTKMNVFRSVDKGWRTSHIETNEEMVKVTGKVLPLDIKPYQMNTYRLLVTRGRE